MPGQNDNERDASLDRSDPPGAGTGGAGGNIGGDPGSQHNDWGHSDAGTGAREQAGQPDGQKLAHQSGQQPGQQPGQQGSAGGNGSGGNIGGVPGGQHNDWGHSPVTDGGSLQSGRGDNDQRGQTPRQGVMPGEEMGHLQRGPDGDAQKG